MTNSLAQIVGAVIIVSSAVVSFLLAQQGVVFDPMVALILGALNVALTTLGLYLNVRMPGQSGPPG